MTEVELRKEMCRIGKRLWERGLVGAAEGNLSCRLDAERLLCTPSGISKGHMTPEDLVVIDLEGTPIAASFADIDRDAKPSSEIKLHLRIYRHRPDCKAVVHAHPTVATAFSAAAEPIPDDLLPEASYVLGSVALVPYGTPGTDEVPDAIEPFLPKHKTFLLSHHGAVAMGCDLEDACFRMETLERIANVLLSAKLLGGPKPLPAAATQVLRGWLGPGLEGGSE